MEERKKLKISLKTAIILIIFIIIAIGIEIYLLYRFLNKQDISSYANGNNISTSSNNSSQYYDKNCTMENNSLGIFNALGLNSVEVNTYNEFQTYINKINELYEINSENTLSNIDESYFNGGKIVFIEYSAMVENCLDIDLKRSDSGNNIRAELYVLDEDSSNKESVKSKFYIVTMPKEFTFTVDIIHETESERNQRMGQELLDEIMSRPEPDEKPIIYLYPSEETEVSVKLLKDENLTCSYPKYQDEWNVLAHPNGDIEDLTTNRKLYSLYYESKNTINFKVEKEGFIVKGKDASRFLEEKLAILGLTERETEEFIIYWLPRLEANKYNYIRFATLDEINENMPLKINPNPDTIIRVLMTFKGLESPIDVKEQELETPNRTGFVAVEWGGTEIN